MLVTVKPVLRKRTRNVGRAASYNNTAESKYDMLVSSMTIIAHNSLCSTRAYHLRIDLAHDATIGERSISIFFLRSRKIYLLDA